MKHSKEYLKWLAQYRKDTPLKVRIKRKVSNPWKSFYRWFRRNLIDCYEHLYVCKNCGTILAGADMEGKNGEKGILWLHHNGYRCWFDFSKEIVWRDGARCRKCNLWTTKTIRIRTDVSDWLWIISTEKDNYDNIPISKLRDYKQEKEKV